MRVCVVDGRGGGVGRELIARLHLSYPGVHDVIGFATNRWAAHTMRKAGAAQVVSSEWAMFRSLAEADVILGPLSMVLAGALEGEVTAELACAILQSRARKILIPLTEGQIDLVGIDSPTLKPLLDAAIRRLEVVASSVGSSD